MLLQNSCTTLKRKDSWGKILSFKVAGSNKELFFKNLDKLFNGFGNKFTSTNTIIMDDSPSKHIMNKCENVILPQAWSYVWDGDRDMFLFNDLLPWIQRLHDSHNQGLVLFQRKNAIEYRMLYDESHPRQYNVLMDAVYESCNIQEVIHTIVSRLDLICNVAGVESVCS